MTNLRVVTTTNHSLKSLATFQDLSLTRRMRAQLEGAGIHTTDELCAKTAADLLAIKGFGRASLRDLRAELTDHGLALAGEPLPEWLRFGPIAREQCGEQCQYASRAVDGRHGYPCLGVGLRFQGDPANYHFLRIHRDDVETFVRRWREHKAGRDPFGEEKL